MTPSLCERREVGDLRKVVIFLEPGTLERGFREDSHALYISSCHGVRTREGEWEENHVYLISFVLNETI